QKCKQRQRLDAERRDGRPPGHGEGRGAEQREAEPGQAMMLRRGMLEPTPDSRSGKTDSRSIDGRARHCSCRSSRAIPDQPQEHPMTKDSEKSQPVPAPEKKAE